MTSAINGSGNTAKALKLFFQHSALSRTAISAELHISTAAVTAIINQLLALRVIQQTETADFHTKRNVGRRQLPLCLNVCWKYLIAVEIHPDGSSAALCNLLGEPVYEEEIPFQKGVRQEVFLEALSSALWRLLKKSRVPDTAVLGIGISILGPVDHQRGAALHPLRMFEEPLYLQDYLKEHFPFPVFVESNICAFLHAQLLYDKAVCDFKTLIAVKWGPGVGSASSVNHKIYKGFNFQSSEIGHGYYSSTEGKKCCCGKRGCLETLISEQCVIEYLNYLIEIEKDTDLIFIAQRHGLPAPSNLSVFLKSGNRKLHAKMSEYASLLAKGVNNAVTILFPDKLLLYGSLFYSEEIFQIFQQQLYAINPTLPSDYCLLISEEKQKRYVGAASIAVSQFLLHEDFEI